MKYFPTLIFNLLKLNFYYIDLKTIKLHLLSNPNYPSIDSIEKTFNSLNINNIIATFEDCDYDILPKYFISSDKGNDSIFFLVEKHNSYVKLFYNSKIISLSREEFLSQWNNLIIAVEKKNVYTYFIDIIIRNSIFIYSFFIYIIYCIFSLEYIYIIFNCLSLFGLFINISILKSVLGESSFVEQICSNTQNKCSLIKNDSTKIIGLKISDWSLLYFTCLSFLGLFINQLQPILVFTTPLSIIFIIISIYKQIKARTYCSICLYIIFILLIQCLIFYFNIYSKASFRNTNNLFFTLFSIFPLLCYLTIRYIKKFNSLFDENVKNLKFRKDYKIFLQNLTSSEKIYFKTPTFSLGNINSNINITFIYSLNCIHCSKSFSIFKKLFSEYNNLIHFNIRFSFNDDETYLIDLINKLSLIYKFDKNNFITELENIFLYKECFNKKEFDYNNFDILAIRNEILSKGITYTPSLLINGYLYPINYDLNDIFYFTDELLEDEFFK